MASSPSDGRFGSDNSVGACQQRTISENVTPVGAMPLWRKLFSWLNPRKFVAIWSPLALPQSEKLVTSESATCPMDVVMLNEYVMDHLFSFLPLTDLRACRLVNRTWNRTSNQTIQKRDFAINLREGRYIAGRYLDRIEVIRKLVQLIRTSFQFPWTKFKVRGGCDAEESRQLETLLHVISPFITEVEIHNLQDIPDNLEYPNLRKLKLKYEYNIIVPTGSNRKSLLQLVERASKLKDIDITGELKTPILMDILKVPNCRKITRLSLSWWIEGKDLVRLSEMGFQLKYLELTFHTNEVTDESVKAILQSQSTCLEYLELACENNYPQSREDFYPRRPYRLLGLECPRMEKLKKLSVQATNLCSRISYKDMFPVLKKLTFRSYDRYPMENFFNDDIEPVETVEYLAFGNWSRQSERVLQAARLFPNLRSVFLIVNQNLLNIVGHAMSQLEEMELLFNEHERWMDRNMDEVLTGFSFEELKTLKGLPSNQLDVLERSNEPVHFLKNLKRLRISSMLCSAQELPLSDLGCRFAFLKMERLKVLEIKGNCSRISEPVMEKMRNKFVVRLVN